jgi:hypothetical protein
MPRARTPLQMTMSSFDGVRPMKATGSLTDDRFTRLAGSAACGKDQGRYLRCLSDTSDFFVPARNTLFDPFDDARDVASARQPLPGHYGIGPVGERYAAMVAGYSCSQRRVVHQPKNPTQLRARTTGSPVLNACHPPL